MVLFHLYAPIAYALLALLFSYWHEGRPARYMRLTIPLFIIAYLALLASGYEDLGLPNKYTLTMMSILIAVITLYTLLSISRGQSTIPIYWDERYWVSFGAFIYYSGNILVFSGIPQFITPSIWLIHNILAIVGNFFYLGAYLCLRK